MSSGTKPCRVCGKPFIPCVTHVAGAFNWRTVACSPECGQKYLYKIMVSRGEIIEEQPAPEAEKFEEESVTEAEVAEGKADSAAVEE